MKNIFTIIVIASISQSIFSCNGKSKANNTTTIVQPGSQDHAWKEITPAAAFPKSYNFQLFAFRDSLWAFHPEGNWYSTDGKEWTKSQLTNSISNHAFLDYIVFKDAIWGLGHLEGNIEELNLQTTIYKTTDLKNWEVVARESELPKRFFYHPFVFNDKIWIIGGRDREREYADIWNSDDAVHWTKVADDLPFGERANSHVIFFNNKLFLLNNDVWSSVDAINWTKETNEIVKGEEIFGYAPVVFDNKIWLLGCNRNGKFQSEVLQSADGKTWIAERAPWSPRGAATACVYNGKVFMTGGKYGGPGIQGQTEFVYSNDVWTLEKTER